MKTKAIKLVIAIMLLMPFGSACAIDNIQSRAFVGRDVHISGDKLTSFHSAGLDVLVADSGLSITAGADTFKGNKGVVWLKRTEPAAGKGVTVWVYLAGRVSATRGKGTRIEGLKWEMLDNNRGMVVWFEASGDVFVTAKFRQSQEVRGDAFYKAAFDSVASIDKDFAAVNKSLSPPPPAEPNIAAPALLPQAPTGQTPAPAPEQVSQGRQTEGAFGFIDRMLGFSKKPEVAAKPKQPRASVRYPVNFAPAGDTEPNIEVGTQLNGKEIATIIGRFYLWQKSDERGALLEMEADAAVVFFSGKSGAAEPGQIQDLGASGAVEAIYVRGDVVMTEGLRTIRAKEMYYDFNTKKGLVVNAELREFDVARGIPIYIRAAKVRRLAENKFAAENVVVTTSEFAAPQVSLEASSILLTDSAAIDQQPDQPQDSSFDAEMRDVRLKADDTTLFYWPLMRSNLERPDTPLKNIRIGHDDIWGTTVETRWFLSRLLGLKAPIGTNETFSLDYLSKRGVGAGTEVDYEQENRQGKILGYIIDDRGKDRLGRVSFRRDLEPPDDLRGRFNWVNRQFLPYNWQVTTGINYESDEHFVESYYRHEFNTGLDRETYVHLKRIEDNWGLAFLGKWRVNNFADELEQSPTVEYHLTGQSLFDDKFTLYSDTQGGRFRQQIGESHSTIMNQDYFTFGSHRTELDMPMLLGGVKMVPFIAGTVGYDDRSGFDRSLVDGSNSGPFNEKTVGIGEAGVRASSQFWNVYPGVKSRLWDLDGLRHIIRPEVAVSVYEESDPVVKQHDAIYAGISQRLQTKRGTGDNQRTVDWMRLDLGATWFEDNDKRTPDSGPYRFLWNNPMTPLRMFTMPGILNGDLDHNLKRFETYGPVRDYFSADYMWQITDTTALLSDAYYDIHNGTFEQVDIGLSRMRWPDLTYYIGSRYLRDVQVLKEHGSNAFVFAASYKLDERYTVVFAQQYDFDYGSNVESKITLIRRYNRVYWSLTFSSDASLDSQAVIFSIWPEGVPELAIGSHRYTGLSQP